MGDSAETLPAAAESVSLHTKVIESTFCPKSSFLSTQTLDPKSSYCGSTQVIESTHATASTLSDDLAQEQEDFSLSEPKKEILTGSFMSAEVLEDGYEKPSMVGAGLANLFNTCFFNAVLQCFTHSVLLVQGLYTHTHPTPCDRSNERFCLICALREHIELLLSSTAKIVSPWKFIDNLTYFSSSFQRYEQEDAHEFLQCFLDRLESSLNNLKAKDDGLSLQTDNLVKRIFGGRVISKLRCCNCNHISDTYEPSVDLSLEIGDVNSLSTALESFTKVEHIEDEEMKFTCDECKQKVSVDKQLMLDQIPLICAFHLKRFKNVGSFVENIDKHVEFPLELDLQPYTCGSLSDNVDLKYELYAVVVHVAFTSSCGHYYCYIRSAPDTWYMFDDSKVTRVSEACVLSEKAYILFYAKQGTPWFSNFMETYNPSFYPNLSTTSPKSVLENVDPPTYASSIDHSPHSDDVTLLKPVNNVVKENPPLIFKEYGSNHKIKAQKSSCVPSTNDSKIAIDIHELPSPSTLSRSPGLDISDDKYTEVVPAAKPKQSKHVEKASCKRQRNNEVENPAMLEAMRLCKRMPGSRGDLLMAAMLSKSENSFLAKSKQVVSSPSNNGSKSYDRFNSVTRKLATSFR